MLCEEAEIAISKKRDRGDDDEKSAAYRAADHEICIGSGALHDHLSDQGIDPANNCPVNDDYLILARGRDFRDCAIDRGVMFGDYTQQLTLVRSVLS